MMVKHGHKYRVRSWTCTYDISTPYLFDPIIISLLLSLCHHMTPSPPGPPWPPQTSHPLRCPLLPQLPLQPPCHLPCLRRLPRLRRNHPHSSDQTLSLCSHNTRAEKPSVLTSDGAQLPLQLWSAGRATEVCHLALCACNDQLVQVS